MKIDSNKIVEALKKGVVTIVFENRSKEIRTMPVILNTDIHKNHLNLRITLNQIH